jgi:hypothetical protein
MTVLLTMLLGSLALFSGCGKDASFPTYSGTYKLVSEKTTFSTEGLKGEIPPPQEITVTHRVDLDATGYQNLLKFDFDVADGHRSFSVDLQALTSKASYYDQMNPHVNDGLELGNPVTREAKGKYCGNLEKAQFFHFLFGETETTEPVHMAPAPSLLRQVYDRGNGLISPGPNELRINEDAKIQWVKELANNNGVTIVLKVKRVLFVMPTKCMSNGTQVAESFESDIGQGEATLVYHMDAEQAVDRMAKDAHLHGSPLLPAREAGQPTLAMSLEKKEWLDKVKSSNYDAFHALNGIVDFTARASKTEE